VERCPSFDALAEFCIVNPSRIPKQLLKAKDADAQHLIRFIESKLASLTIERHRENFVTSWVKEAREQEAASLEAVKISLIKEYSRWLASPDHLPIDICLGICDKGVAQEIKVVSYNVMEHVRDGVSIFLQSLPFISGTKAQPKLVAAITSPIVLAQHAEDISSLIDQMLVVKQYTAVCLQEVDPSLLKILERHATSRGLHLHVSASAQELKREPDACLAITCIISRLYAKPLPDVVLISATKGGQQRFRRFTAVKLSECVDLLSLHVRHQSIDTGIFEQAENEQHIQNAREAIIDAHIETLDNRGIVVAVGDFNGPVPCTSTEPSGTMKNAAGDVGVRWLGPKGGHSTHYRKPSPVDGMMLFSKHITNVDRMECSLLENRERNINTNTMPWGL